MKRTALLFIILLALIPCAAAHAEEKTKYEKLITGLELLSDFEDGTFRSDAYVTNEEFFRAVYKMSEKTMPEDIKTASDELTDSGILKRSLNPDEALRSDDLIYSMTKLLGYASDNYEKDASDAGLYQGANLKDGYVTRQSFSRILYNTLTTDKMGLSNIQGDKIVFEKDGNILENVFGVKRIIGVADADRTAYIEQEPNHTLSKGDILIDGITVSGVADTKAYLARRVEAFLKFEENDDNHATAVLIEKYNNNETKATSQFIDGATTSSRLVWLDPDSEKLKQESIPSDAVVIYNGQRMGTAQGQEWSLFTPGDGEVNLIDNDGDREAEAVIIWSYTTYVTDYVNLASDTIFSKDREAVVLEEREYTIYDADGNEISLEDIKSFDVLSVAFGAEDSDEIIIRRSSGKTASGIYRRDGYNIFVGNDSYSIGGSCDLQGISDADQVVVYLDIYDRAAYVVKESEYEYAFLTKTVYANETDEVIYLKLYTFDEGVVKLETADTVTLIMDYGRTKYYRNKVGVENSYRVLYELIKNRQELIKFKRNREGQIREILLCNSKIGQDMPDTESGFDVYYGIAGESVGFREAKFLQNSFATRFRVTDDTKMLSIEGDKSAPEKFVRVSVSDLIADNDYMVIVYDVNERFEAGVVIIEKIEDWYSKFGSLVAGISYAVGEDGEALTEFSVYTSGELKSIYADDLELVSDEGIAQRFENAGTKLKDIAVGDVIYYNLNNEGKISSFAESFLPAVS